MSLADAFVPIDINYRNAILTNTWGHLAPKKNKVYRGHLTFAVGIFGSDNLNPTAIECEFEDLDSSPWFYTAMMEFMQSLEMEAGKVYRFDGKFKNYHFKGSVRELKMC